ncbi:MAG: substrate-binding domain-containing protein [Phycisphaerales bacterium]
MSTGTVTNKSPKRKYERIFETIRIEIQSGRFKDGDALASEAQLCEQFDVSRGPVRQALSELERQGLIRRHVGKGSFVYGVPRAPQANRPEMNQVVALINATSVSPANFVAFELIEGLNQASEGADDRYRLNFQFHRRNNGIDPVSIPDSRGLMVAPFTDDGVRIFRQLAKAKSPGIPVVSLYNRLDLEGVSEFYVDHHAGAFEATSFLARYGHRRIAMLAEPGISPGPAAVQRMAGFEAGLQAAGISGEAAGIVQVGLEPVTRRSNIVHLLRRPDRPTALLVAGGVITPDVLFAIREVGLNIPNDISVIAFDDTAEAAANDPGLTVVRVPLRRMTRLAMDWMVDQIEGHGSGKDRVSTALTPDLVVRQSCSEVAHAGD